MPKLFKFSLSPKFLHHNPVSTSSSFLPHALFIFRTEKRNYYNPHLIKVVLFRVNEQRNILHEIRKRKANWIGHFLRRNCLLKQVIKGKIKGEMEVARRRGRRRKMLKDRRAHSHLKEEDLDRTMWRHCLEEALDLSSDRIINDYIFNSAQECITSLLQ